MDDEVLCISPERVELLKRIQNNSHTLERAGSLKEFLKVLGDTFQRSRGYRTPLLPSGVRYFEQVRNRTVAVVEQFPQIRTVLWINDGEVPDIPYDGYVQRALAFPYMVFLLSFDGEELDGKQQLYYRTSPLVSLDDSLYKPNVLNVTIGRGSRACWLCLGKEERAVSSWFERVSEALAFFWSTGFNHDFEAPRGSGFTRLKELDARISSAGAWERASQQDPLFPLTIPWPEAGLTLREAIDETLVSGEKKGEPSSLEELGDILYRVQEVL